MTSNSKIYRQVFDSRSACFFFSISGSHLFGYNAMILWRFSAAESVELSMLMLLSNATITLIIALSNPAGERLHL